MHRIAITTSLFTAALAIPMAGPASAAVVYIDADSSGSGNTVLDGAGTILSGTNVTQAFDGNWSTRPRAGVNGGSVLVSINEAPPRLITTFELPSPGIYDIYGYYYAANDWVARFELGNGGSIETYSSSNGTDLSGTSNHFTDPNVSVADGSIPLYEASLGQWNTAVDGTTVTVYTSAIDQPGADGRTWYDGVGYEAVPEPGSLALLGLGGLFVLRRRRSA